MPESEISILETLRKTNVRPDSTSFKHLSEEASKLPLAILYLVDIKHKLDELFGKGKATFDDENAEAKERKEQESLKQQEEKQYESVDEGKTTDTTEASETGHTKRTSLEQAAKEKAAKEGEEEQPEEGILSSEDEQVSVQ